MRRYSLLLILILIIYLVGCEEGIPKTGLAGETGSPSSSPSQYCGDGSCNGDEDCQSCSSDCDCIYECEDNSECPDVCISPRLFES